MKGETPLQYKKSMRFISIFIAAATAAASLFLVGCSNADNDAAALDPQAIAYLADPDMYYGSTFGQGDVIDICIDISDDDWQDICTNAVAEEYHSANITVNGTTVENVGFRTKGFSSLTTIAQSDSDRYGFKVKTDEYTKGQTINGLDMLVLNGSFCDPSYMREYLTYLANAKLGCITPFVAYSRLYINGELFGFYLAIEAYDDSFTARCANAEASLYKASSENCTLTSNDDASGFTCSSGNDDEGESIRDMISVLNTETTDVDALEAVLDVDSALKAFAVNTVMGNYDSYNGSKAHNYYLLDDGGKLTYIGWDYNMSIGAFSEDNGSSVSVSIDEPVYNVSIAQRPLIGKLLAVDEYMQRYHQYVNTLTEYLADAENIVNSISAIIRPYVEADPTAFYTVEQYDANISISTTDLSSVQHGGGMSGDGTQILEGGASQSPSPESSGFPQTSGENEGQAPMGTPPADIGGTGGFPGGTGGFPGGSAPDASGMPQMPDASGMPQMPDASGMPQMPNASGMPNGGGQMPGGMGGQMPGGMGMNSDVCSILDYLIQRISFIQQ